MTTYQNAIGQYFDKIELTYNFYQSWHCAQTRYNSAQQSDREADESYKDEIWTKEKASAYIMKLIELSNTSEN